MDALVDHGGQVAGVGGVGGDEGRFVFGEDASGCAEPGGDVVQGGGHGVWCLSTVWSGAHLGLEVGARLDLAVMGLTSLVVLGSSL